MVERLKLVNFKRLKHFRNLPFRLHKTAMSNFDVCFDVNCQFCFLTVTVTCEIFGAVQVTGGGHLSRF